MRAEEIDQAFAENQFHLDAMKPETIKIKVEHDGWAGWYAAIDGACLCPECVNSVCNSGKTIQDAIDALMETLQEKRAAKADPNDNNFVYELNYTWS